MDSRRLARRLKRQLQGLLGRRFPTLAYRLIPLARDPVETPAPARADSGADAADPAGAGRERLAARLAALRAKAEGGLGELAVALVGGEGLRPGLAEAVRLVDSRSAADLVLVEPTGLAPDRLWAVAAALDPSGPARWLWLTGPMAESEPFIPEAGAFDFVFAADLDVALELSRALGPGRVGLAPLAGRTAADGGAETGPAASETWLDPALLERLMAAGRAEAPYSRAVWNFFGQLGGPGRTVAADPAEVAREHSYRARLRQMIDQTARRWPERGPWPEIASQLAQAAARPEDGDRGWRAEPQAWPTGRHRSHGGRLDAKAVGEELVWQAVQGRGVTFSRVLSGSLPLAKVAPEGRLFVELTGRGPVEGQVAVTLTDSAGSPVQSSWYGWNARHPVIPAPGAERLRLAVRTLGDGAVRFTSLKLPDHERHDALPLRWSGERVLIISEGYPAPEDIYSFGFVHTRVKAYQAAGFEVDVMVMRPGGVKRWREYLGVQVLEGSQWLLGQMLDSGRYDMAAVHFLKPHLWETLAPRAARLPLVIWVHGSDIQPWWRHRHLIESAEKQAWYEAHTARLMQMWGQVLTAPGAKTRFVFVSQTFAGEVAEDLAQFGLAVPAGRVAVIHNGVDTDLFAYRPKGVEQRKRILMVRSFATRKYATDLAAAAILELSREPFFNQLEFLIVGDGALWEEDMRPLARFGNVKFERRFMAQEEIAAVQRDYGVMLQPTRWDSQGVSRDEAMSSGMVVISNAVAAVPEFLSQAEGYLAAPDDAAGIAAAVRDLYHHPDVFAAKSAAAAARARSTMAVAQVAGQELALLKDSRDPTCGKRQLMSADRPHVVMAVANPIAMDARVRKTAAAVAEMGYQVTLLWADDVGHQVTEGAVGGAKTIGLPVAYQLRADTLRRFGRRAALGRNWTLIGYPDARARRVKAAELAARRARLDAEGTPASLRAAEFVHRLRSKVQSLRANRHQRRYEAWRRRLPWERELANVADLDGVFTPRLVELRPDVLHLHDIHLLSAGVHAKRRLAALGRAPRLIYDAHEYVSGMRGGNPFQEAAYAAVERELAGEADAVVTVSEPIADLLARDFGLARRPTVVLNSPPLAAGGAGPEGPAASAAAGPSLRAAVDLPPGAALAVYSGVLHTNRNLGPLIDAFALLDDAHLALVCVPGPHTPVARQLAERAARQGLGDRVHLVGPVPPEQVVRFLSSASLGVHPMALGLPNHELALPNKLFDYIWAGLPLAVSDVEVMGGLVRQAHLGFTFDPEDPASIAAAIRRVLERRAELAAAVRAPQLRERFAWEAQVAKLAELYAELAPLPGAA
ncbi:MAG: glycosyltransferase family 4 protein [Bifidobacteriaceae bacterium]|jgi:glycosyltransferase involved in cell wall biosynthesis|nr:glycosyltransferase family 4 protein [Bifidobacteriaceae bacterium]